MSHLGEIPVTATVVDIGDAVTALCDCVGIKKTSVAEIHVMPDELCLDVWLGRDGIDEGRKFAVNGEPAAATLRYSVLT